MKKIVLLCNMGMSTSMMVTKMKEAAAREGFECSIAAYSMSKASEMASDADAILVGPQIKFQIAKVKAACPGVPVKDISMKDYGVMNGAAALKMAREMMNA